MAQQNTNAIAYNQLKPLENTNIGGIIEEHLRFWKKYDDDLDAKNKIEKAQQAKFKAERNKESVDLYDGIIPAESEGYLNSQIISAFERNKDQYKVLAQQYASGDMEAGLKLKEAKKKFENLILTNTTYSKKAQELALQKKEGLGNEYLDEGVESFANSIGKSLFKVNDDLSVDVYDPSIKDVKRLPNGSLLTNSYLQSSLNPKANFKGNGEAIAKNLLDKNDGNSVITAETRLDGIRLVQGLFAQDNVELRSFLGNVRKNEVTDQNGNVVKFNDENGNPLSMQQIGEKPVLMTKLASLYYDNYVKPNISETTVDTRLEDALKRAQLAKLKKEEEAEDPSTNIGVAKKIGGANVSVTPYTGGKQTDTVYFVKDDVFYDVVNKDSNTRFNLTGIVENGNDVRLIGSKVERIPKYSDETDENDNPIIIGYTDGKVENIEITDPVIQNKMATKIEVNSKKPADFSELPALLREASKKQSTTSTPNKILFN